MADVPVNSELAAKALAFFDRLRLPDVPGNPTLREACGDWFREVLVAFLASEDPETKQRLVWELLCMVPKKSSKTTYSAALALTALYVDQTPNGQMLLIGPSQNISKRLFKQARGMIRLDSRLSEIFRVQDHNKTISRYKTGTELQVKTFDTSIVTGEIPILTIVDELHELGKKSGAQQVMQQVRGGGITTTGGRLLMITTQSDREPAGIWKAEIQKARAIRDGRGGSAPIMLPVLYEFPEELQRDEAFWRDRENWSIVLPNLDRSISWERLLADYENNGSASDVAERIWVSQHLNIEIGLGLHADRWIGADYWLGQERDGLALEEILDSSDVAVVGVDGGGADDLFGLAVIGRHAETKHWQVWVRAWCLPDVLERHEKEADRLRDFETDEDLRILPVASDHVLEAADICEQVLASGLMPDEGAIGMDPSGAAALEDELEGRGFSLEGQVQGVGQGWRLHQTIVRLERRLYDGRIVHGGQGLLAWAVGNAKAERRGNNIYISKSIASGKIDPLIALLNAASLMDRNPVVGSKVVTIPENYLVG